MLSRPTFSIRKLIPSPQKKHDGPEDYEGSYFYHDDDDDMDTLSKLKTWRPPMGLMRRSKPSIDIRRSEDLHRIICIPPLPDTPQSSTTSLCSVDNNGNGYAPTSPEAITVTPPAETPGECSSNVIFSQGTQLLVAEPDEGLQLQLQQTLSSAKLSDQELDKFPKPKSSSPTSPPVRRKSQRRSQGSVKSVKSPTKTSMKDPLLPAQARLPSNSRPKRAKSKKSRRRPRAPARQSSMWQLTESAKDLFTIRIFHRIEVDEMLPESTLREIRMSRSAHWTRSPELGVTHVDKKSAAATPIEPLSLDDSLDAAAGEGVVTPRASVVNQGAGADQEECKTPTAVPELRLNGIEGANGEGQVGEQAEQGNGPLPLQLPDSPTTKSYDGDDEECTLPIMMMVEDEATGQTQAALAPSPMPPPTKSPMHRRLPSRQLPPLPTIPEIITTGPEEAILSPTSAPAPPLGSPNKVSTDDYVYLQSNPYTLTMQTFRHGQIRLAKADLPIGKLAAAVDDTLDWTAFQMAILGGAGDFFSEPTDYSRPSEAELDELEELASWFGSFGFQTAGSLVGPSQPRTPSQPWTPVLPRTPALSPPSPTSTPNSSPRTVVSTGSSNSNGNNNNRSPGIRRIDPPVPTDSDGNGTKQPPLSDSIAGRFFPAPSPALNNHEQPLTKLPLPLPPLSPSTSTSTSRHRRSASSTTFGTHPTTTTSSTTFPPQNPAPKKTTTTMMTATPTPHNPKSAFESRRNHAGLAIDAGRGKHQQQQRGRRPSVDSIQSLPQSPMMDLVVSHDVEGNEYVVPMGFNLSHDLGDFLTWHAEHVSGGGFHHAGGLERRG
ncbi:hypothetical protein NEMBOFW57_003449 [Staphylotrichum longicolle]|uniref:Uncharacterized protein n=1 Tax=Staphylotrichum longicolle TaxID=669026 RepID=A0AAD4F5A9_9PEZI|nr:hypothetical protein NEMBOFW57_003449 [Staphylotrichum longicolle]